MNLNDINSGPTPNDKFWLNPICNKLTCNTLVTNSADIGQLLSSAGVRNNYTGGTLSVSDIITGVVGINSIGSGGLTITNIVLPSGGALDTALSQFTPPFYFTTNLFITYTNTGTGRLRFNLSGMTSYNSIASPIDYDIYINGPANVQNKIQMTLIFARSNSGWVFYA
jgi:hypothetical protein